MAIDTSSIGLVGFIRTIFYLSYVIHAPASKYDPILVPKI